MYYFPNSSLCSIGDTAIGGYYTTAFSDKELDPDKQLYGRSAIVIHPEFFLELGRKLRHETSHFLDRPADGEGRKSPRIIDLLSKMGKAAIEQDASLAAKVKFLLLGIPTSAVLRATSRMFCEWRYFHFNKDEQDARDFELQYTGEDFISATTMLST